MCALLSLTVPPLFLTILFSQGNTVLHYAVSHGNLEVVTLFLDSELCDVNLQNKAGYSAIMLAALADVQTEQQRRAIGRLFRLGDINSRASQVGLKLLCMHCITILYSLHRQGRRP
jgi:hypothetical protein